MEETSNVLTSVLPSSARKPILSFEKVQQTLNQGWFLILSNASSDWTKLDPLDLTGFLGSMSLTQKILISLIFYLLIKSIIDLNPIQKEGKKASKYSPHFFFRKR